MREPAPRAMRYLRGLGWAALAATPILLGALALLSARPALPEELTTHAMIAAWIAGSLAFAASLLAARGARVARVPIAMSALVVIGFSGFLVWLAMHTPPGLDARERAELVQGGDRLVHPHLRFSIPASDLERSPNVALEMSARGGPVWASAHQLYTWRGDDTEIVLDVSRVQRADRAALETGLEEIAGPLDDPRIERDGLAGQVEAELARGGTVIARIALIERRGRAYRVAITIVTSDAERWRSWLEHAQLRPR